MSKARKLYILVAVAVSIAVVAVVLAWLEGYLRSAIILGVGAAGWGFFFLVAVRKAARRPVTDKTRRTTKIVTRGKRWTILLRGFSLLLIVFSIASLVKVLVSSKPVFLILELVWLIVISVGHLLFVRLVTDD